MASININDSSFDKEVLKSNNLTLVDFWAEWCGPCKMIGPALEEISEEMKDDVRITKLNIDENPATPQNMVSEVFQLYFFSEMERLLQKKLVLYQKLNCKNGLVVISARSSLVNF